MMGKRLHTLPKTVVQGLRCYNQGQFFLAHEYFETAWRETQGETREFFRALLHLSGGFFRLSQNRPSAALKFFSRARHWLMAFPSPYYGINTTMMAENLDKIITVIDQAQSSESIVQEFFQPILPEGEGRSP